MNHDDPVLEPGDVRHVIDALIDGEPVDKDTLRSALADATVREYFIDALLLRQLAADMGPTAFQPVARTSSAMTKTTRWIAAAAVVAATTIGGYAVGRDRQARSHVNDAVGASVSTTSAPPAPAPTRVIRFEPGKDWISNVEGH